MDIIVGTAGHIDHGKTALVKALTGIDADRLPEEKERGITIDIGFAELDLGAVRIGFVDVPGHEKFIKNMLAGASGIDMVLLVIAADEGVMPQTREHFEICRLLGIQTGLVVLTKTDLVDEETLELARLDVSELVRGSFLDSSKVIAVSSRSGAGIVQLKDSLAQVGCKVRRRNAEQVSRLAIDRSFSIKGHGAVVTGTVASGDFAIAQEIELLPLGKYVKVRGLQTHGRKVESVLAGQRAAINLGGIDSSDVARGMVLTEKGTLQPTQIIDTEIEVLGSSSKPVRSRQRVRVSIGTIEALARVQVLDPESEVRPGKRGLVQFRLESPIVALPGERFIIRSYSPQTTIAGGLVIDPIAPRHRRREIESTREFLQRLGRCSDRAELVQTLTESYGEQGSDLRTLQSRSGLRRAVLEGTLTANVQKGAIVESNGTFVGRAAYERLKARTLSELEEFHAREPIAKGMLRETLREKIFRHVDPAIFRSVLKSLADAQIIVSEGETVKLAGHGLNLSAADAGIREKLEKVYLESGFEVPKFEDALAAAAGGTTRENTRKIFQLLINEGRVVKVSEEFYFSRAVLDQLKASLRSFADATSDRLIDVAKFKEIAGISRKYAIPLLEYFDREKVTRRAGDKRFIL
jgi:selenocysteine-specific elongation factor